MYPAYILSMLLVSHLISLEFLLGEIMFTESTAESTPSATKYLQQGALPLPPNIYSREHSLGYKIGRHNQVKFCELPLVEKLD